MNNCKIINEKTDCLGMYIFVQKLNFISLLFNNDPLLKLFWYLNQTKTIMSRSILRLPTLYNVAHCVFS